MEAEVAIEAAGPHDGGGSSVYSAYISEQVAREDSRKASLEGRSLAVVTSAGALATLLFGLAAFDIHDTGFKLPHSAEIFLSLALLAFFFSAVFAIGTNAPSNYEEVKPDELREAVKERWVDPRATAEKKVALTRIKTLQSARIQNNRKADLLFRAIVAQGIAVAFVAVSVLIIIL